MASSRPTTPALPLDKKILSLRPSARTSAPSPLTPMRAEIPPKPQPPCHTLAWGFYCKNFYPQKLIYNMLTFYFDKYNMYLRVASLTLLIMLPYRYFRAWLHGFIADYSENFVECSKRVSRLLCRPHGQTLLFKVGLLCFKLNTNYSKNSYWTDQ